MRRQCGVTLVTMIAVAFLIVLVALLVLKVVPVYIEYHTIQKHFRSMAADPGLKNARRPEVVRAWIARADVDNITSVKGENISLEREGERLVISADYSVKVPVFQNLNFCFDFHPTSR